MSAVGIFCCCCYCLPVLGALGFFGEGHVVWFVLLGFGFFLGKDGLLSPGFKLTP